MQLRFTVRDLLWLTALVAVLVAWWLDHSPWTAKKTEEGTYFENEKTGETFTIHDKNHSTKGPLFDLGPPTSALRN